MELFGRSNFFSNTADKYILFAFSFVFVLLTGVLSIMSDIIFIKIFHTYQFGCVFCGDIVHAYLKLLKRMSFSFIIFYSI